MAPRLKLFAIGLLTILLTACNVKRIWYRLLPPDMAWYLQDTPDSKDNHPPVKTTCGRGTGRDNRYGVTVLPIPSLETNFPTIGIDGIFDLLKKKTSLGDALIMAVARKQLPFVSTMITWDDDHFEGKFPGTVLTSEEFMWSAELV